MRPASLQTLTLRTALIGLLLGLGTAAAEPPAPNAELEATEEATEVETPRRFSAERILAQCERVLPICQPAIAWRTMESGISNLRELPMLQPIPTVQLDPRISRPMTAVATGLILRTARDTATDPFSLDPLRYFSPAQREMVGIHTTADQLGELAHPIIGSNSFRPTPKSSEETDSD
jgi:hypothetical protein